jgi:hypothetical protein
VEAYTSSSIILVMILIGTLAKIPSISKTIFMSSMLYDVYDAYDSQIYKLILSQAHQYIRNMDIENAIPK